MRIQPWKNLAHLQWAWHQGEGSPHRNSATSIWAVPIWIWRLLAGSFPKGNYVGWDIIMLILWRQLIPGIALKNHKIGHIAEMTLLRLGLVKWTCKVCDNVSCQKELWRTTMEKSIFRTRNCKPFNKELVLRGALKNHLLGPLVKSLQRIWICEICH